MKSNKHRKFGKLQKIEYKLVTCGHCLGSGKLSNAFPICYSCRGEGIICIAL